MPLRPLRLCLVAGAVVIIVVFGTYGYNYDPVNYLIMSFAVLPLYAAFRVSRTIRRKGRVEALEKMWGSKGDPGRKRENVELLHELLLERGDEPIVDDVTWTDLGFDEVFARIDQTRSTPGRTTLYSALRRPLLESDRIENRAAVIERLGEDRGLRFAVFDAATTLGEQKGHDVVRLLWGSPDTSANLLPLAVAMFSAAILSIVMVFVVGPGAIIFPAVPVFLSNAILHTVLRRRFEHRVESVSYLRRMISAARRLVGQNGIGDVAPQLGKATARVAGVYRRTGFVLGKRPDPSDILDVAVEYINALFLLEVLGYYASRSAIENRKSDLKVLFRSIGELDALLSAASFRETYGVRCVPEFTEGTRILADGIVHPLLPKPVANSIDLGRPGIVLTGSNMSGKSTLLRAIGLNQILAQSIVACAAQSYRTTVFRVVSSISKRDDLAAGKSSYLTEAERIHDVIRFSAQSPPLLAIIDEVLSGTNTVERVRAAIAILRYLAERNAITIAATHDLEIAQTMTDSYTLLHLADDVNDDGITFDYTLKAGIVSTRNAIRLLEHLGYPKEILEDAKKNGR